MLMNNGTEIILQQFWGVRDLSSVTTEQIEAKCEEYPFFSPLQLLLAKKYKEQQPASYKKQAQKAAVYFNNWYWLNDLLEGRISFGQAGMAEAAVVPATEDRMAVPFLEQTPDPLAETIATASAPAEEALVISDLKAVAIPPIEVVETALPVVEEEPLATITTEPSAEFNEAPVATDTFLEPETPLSIVRQPEAEEPLLEASRQDTKEVPLPGLESIKKNISLLKNTLADLDSGSSVLIPIEPLHTIDYFASQGIKLKDLGIDPTDNLGQKLRSFTEWLKTMKKLHPEKIEGKIDEKAQSSIQHMAEHSNVTEIVLTEAIAEVYAQQGLKEKAREVYQKLSLQNPDKSTYFAAKISKLNEL